MDVYQRRRLVALSAIAAIFIVFVLLIRSCGGDDETTTPTPVAGASGVTGATSQPKSAYIDQADAICLDTNNAIASVDTSQTTADAELSQAVSGELQQLQSLTPPDQSTNDLDDFLTAVDKQANAYDDKATAIEHGDTASATEIDATLDQAASDAADAADAFGFKVCGDTSKVSDNSDSGDSTDTSTDDTGGTVTPTTTTPPATTPPATTPPTDTGTPPAPTDGGTGGTGSDSGGVSP